MTGPARRPACWHAVRTVLGWLLVAVPIVTLALAFIGLLAFTAAMLRVLSGG